MMKLNQKWTILTACALFGLAVSMPAETVAQSKSKTTVKRSASKAKKSVPKKKAAKKATVAKAKPTKAVVLNKGAFRPLTDTDRVTVILPRRPAIKSDLTMARNRTTVYTNRTVTASANNVNSVTARNYGTTAVIVNSANTSWWGYGGPPSTTYYDNRHGWITVVNYSWGNVMYTYGYQVVNYWDGADYVWMSYPGVAGVAYPVLYR